MSARWRPRGPITRNCFSDKYYGVFVKSHDNHVKSRQLGLTLIELMVALVVISLSVLAVYQMFITGRELIIEQFYRQNALERAQARLERLQYYEIEYDSIPLDQAGIFVDTLVERGPEHVGILARCEIEIEHSEERDLDTGLPYWSLVIVRYDWEAPSGRQYNIELQSKF